MISVSRRVHKDVSVKRMAWGWKLRYPIVEFMIWVCGVSTRLCLQQRETLRLTMKIDSDVRETVSSTMKIDYDLQLNKKSEKKSFFLLGSGGWENIEKVGWVEKDSFVSGGRITLIQPSLFHIPSYFLSLFKIPASIASKIEKLRRDFLWSGVGEGKKDHLIRWDVICRPKELKGLGFGKTSLRNNALLRK